MNVSYASTSIHSNLPSPMLPQYNSGGPMDGHPTTPRPSVNVGMSKIAHLLSQQQNQDVPLVFLYLYIYVCVSVCALRHFSFVSLRPYGL